MTSSPKPLAILEGTVIHGKKLGQQLGIPTANVPYIFSNIALRDGVYVAALELLNKPGKLVPGVLNQGHHPTVPEGKPTIEIHLFDFDETLYDHKVRIYYLSFIRPEQVFKTKEEMRLAVLRDIKYAIEWHQIHDFSIIS